MTLPQTRCSPCQERVVLIPGPRGEPGPPGLNGLNGADGRSAVGRTTAHFVTPPIGQTVQVQVDTVTWAAVGMIVYVGTAGWYRITTVSGNTLTLENTGWTGNTPPGVGISSGNVVAPTGPKGADGVAGAPTAAKYWVVEADSLLPNAVETRTLSTGYLRVQNGVGTPQTVPKIPSGDLSTTAPANNVFKSDGSGNVVHGRVLDAELDHAVVTVGGTDINWQQGRVFFKVLTANVTFTFSNPVPGKTILVVLKQDTATPRTVTWPSTVKWQGGLPVPITASPGAYAAYSFLHVDGVFLAGVANDRR